jgi:hypothetical protein
MLGIEFLGLPFSEKHGSVSCRTAELVYDERGPHGLRWYVIDVNILQGSRQSVIDESGELTVPRYGRRQLEFLRALTPIDRIGYSYYVYSLTLEEVARLNTL